MLPWAAPGPHGLAPRGRPGILRLPDIQRHYQKLFCLKGLVTQKQGLPDFFAGKGIIFGHSGY